MSRFFLPALGIINALGSDIDEISKRLFTGDTNGVRLENGWIKDKPARVGSVRAPLPKLPQHLATLTCRNNQLLLAAYMQIAPTIDAAIEKFGAARIGIVLGTSTSGMAEGEAAIAAFKTNGKLPENYHYIQQELGTPALFLARYLKILGPAYTISTACTSSAKAFQSARNLLKHNICDAVLVGGVDSLCKLTINGFSSLESISDAATNPMSVNRQGINIGEGAALFLMMREASEIELLGIGESSDAYHMSAPHPQGLGAEAAMIAALQDAEIGANKIGYLNLHATGTIKNDEMESHAVARVFNHDIACSGTKPMTGHTLGAAGATELAFCWMALTYNQLPPHVWDGEQDPNLSKINLIGYNHGFTGASRQCMSNSFAFGGSNASLIIGDNTY